MSTEQGKKQMGQELCRQIEEIYNSFKDIHTEAIGIVSHAKASETIAHLEDVLQSTENATNAILDAAAAIDSAESREAVSGYVTQIYEACNFQDITGQRIKKVLKSYGLMEQRMAALALAAKKYAEMSSKETAEVKTEKEDSLLNGPQLSAVAPTQEEIDRLFSSF